MTSHPARSFFAAVFSALLASPALAQPVGTAITADLNNDGRAERFTLIDDGDGSADLRIETGGGVIEAENIAWVGGIGQQPELGLAPNGSLRLISMNEAIGRNRWRLTLTIAYRRGAYMVAGYTYDWYDTIELEDNGSCDLNLLTGKGTLARGDSPARPIRTSLNPRRVTAWQDDVQVPEICRGR